MDSLLSARDADERGETFVHILPRTEDPVSNEMEVC